MINNIVLFKVTYNTHITGAKHKKKEKNKALIRDSKSQENSASSSLQPPKPKKSKKNVIDFRVSFLIIY